MNKPSIGFVLLRGLGWGLLVAFINGLSLPSLIDLYSRILKVLNTGVWYNGPFLVLELWLVFFTFGVTCSFLPAVIAGNVLSLGIQKTWTKKAQGKWLKICVGVALGVAVAAWYVLALFYTESLLNLREDGLLAVFILVEQVIIYGWLSARLSPHQQM